MANKDANRQRRTNQNRAKRAALAARTSGEAVKRPSRIAPATADKLKSQPRSTSRAGELDPSEAPERDTAASKAAPKKRERPPRPGDRPVDIATLEGSFFRKVTHVPGGLQVLMSVALAVMVSVMTGRQKMYRAPGMADVKDAPFTRTMFDALGAPRAWAFLLLPVVASLVAVAFSLHKQRRRVWVVCAMVVFAVIALNVVMFNYVFVGGFLLYAVWRSQRIEGPARPIRPRRGAANEDEGDPNEATAEADDEA